MVFPALQGSGKAQGGASAMPETENLWQIPPGVSTEPAKFSLTVELYQHSQTTDMQQQETAIKGPEVYLLHK